MPRVTVDPGQPVTITLVHPHAPVADRQAYWREDLDLLLRSLPAVTGHHLLIGDFNASRDLRPFRRLLQAGYADSSDIARKRPWPGLTFPANVKIPPLMRLDHILVSPTGPLVHETRHLHVPGTDHLGVLAVMDLPPITSAGHASSERTAQADAESAQPAEDAEHAEDTAPAAD
jgi:endonuclease/exonuclease/phosphatase (EEP) superfamily protein YafD